MLVATLYKVSKKENSTYVPTANNSPLGLQIMINDGDSSILSPSIRITPPANTRVIDYNYLYIPDFGRYYYVNNWVWNADGTWTGFCSVDVLSTWKDRIIASPGYVGRAESPHVDPYIQDRFYISRNTPVTIRDNADTGFRAAPNLGTFLIGVSSAKDATTGTGNGNLGGVAYYMLTSIEYQSLSQSLLGIYDSSGNQLATPAWKIREGSSFKADAWQSLNNPIQYVISSKFYPTLLFDPTGVREQIVMGGWAAGGLGGHKLVRLYDETPWKSIPISNVNQVGQYDPEDFPTYAPYANYILQTPWGEYTLDPNIMSIILMRETPTLYWKLVYNFSNGTATLVVADSAAQTFPESVARSTTHELIRTEIKVATDVALQATYKDDLFTFHQVGNAMKGFFGIGSGIMSSIGGAMGGSIGSIGSGVEKTMTSAIDTTNSIIDAVAGAEKTAQGTTFTECNVTPVITQISVQQTRYSTVGRSPSMFGKPYKRPVSNLNGYTGFVQLDYSQFTAECTEIERSNVIKYLLGGVYIE